MDKTRTLKYFILLISLSLSPLLYAKEVGQVQYTRGAVTMQNMDGSNARLVAKNEILQRGDVLRTGPRSFTIIKLKDGTRMTIRPNSSFTVEKFEPKQDSTASAILRLFRGGMRAITGYISKRNPNGYQVKTSVVTLGIRGTEFDVRLCQDDCDDENNKHKKSYDKLLESTVARAVFVRRGLVAKSVDGVSRDLKAGSAIFEGDTLVTRSNAYAILVFKDKSRVSLQANTVFRVDEMKFKEDKAEESTALFSLLRGGLRTITGLIGKLNPRKYSMRTSVATIGIRGTGYDLMCTGSCMVSGEYDAIKPEKIAQGDGLYGYVWDGSIDFGGQALSLGRAAYKADNSAAPVVLPGIPDFFKNNTVPKPASFKVDEKQLFSKLEPEEAPAGVYISVTEGNVVAQLRSGEKLDMKAGQSGYADVLGRQAKMLSKTPSFQKFDAYPMPDVANPAKVNINANAIGSKESGMSCEIR